MSRSQDAGFTLLEVLIAVFLLSIFAVNLNQMMTEGQFRLSVSNQRDEALRHAETMTRKVLSDARGGNVPELGITDGVVGDEPVEDEQSSYLWQMEVDEYEIDLPKELEEFATSSPIFLDELTPRARRFPVMRRVAITVHQASQAIEAGETLTTYLVEPAAGAWEGSLGGGVSGRGSASSSSSADGGNGEDPANRRRPRRPGPAIGIQGGN